MARLHFAVNDISMTAKFEVKFIIRAKLFAVEEISTTAKFVDLTNIQSETFRS